MEVFGFEHTQHCELLLNVFAGRQRIGILTRHMDEERADRSYVGTVGEKTYTCICQFLVDTMHKLWYFKVGNTRWIQ